MKAQVTKMNDRSCETYNAKDVTTLIEQNECVRAEIEKVKQHYKELYDSIKITHAHTSEKTSTMLNEIEVKAQLKSKVSYVTMTLSNQKFLAPSMEIVEEARVVKPLDNAFNSACRYTKLSQELLEYVIGTCPKEFNERDNKAPSTPLTRKKQVTFNDKPRTSTSNTQKHVVQQKVQQSNVPVIPSTRVSSSTDASRSKPRSNTKKNRILPAKSENKMKVEDHPRTNKSVWTKVNRVESSISSKRVVINSNSESVCKTCNKCLISANHDMCVIKPLNSVNATPTVKNGLNKVKQVWKVKGKLSANGLNKAKQVWKATGKVFANVGYQWRPTRKKFTLGKHIGGHQWRPTGKMFLLGEQCPLTRLPVKCRTDRPLVSGLRLFKTYDGESFKAQEVCEKVPREIQASFFIIMASVDVSSGPAPHRKEKCTLQCALSLKEEKSSCFRPFSSTSFIFSHARSDVKKGYRIIQQENSSIDETIHVTFDEMHQTMAPDHPLDNIIGNPSRPVSTRKQLASDALWCCFHTELSKVEPKNFKMAVKKDMLVQSNARLKFTEFDRHEKSLLSDSLNDLKTKKSYARLSSEEGSLWAKAGTKDVMRIMRNVRIREYNGREVPQFLLEIDWFSWSSKSKEARAISTTGEQEKHCNVWMLCSNPLDEILAKRLRLSVQKVFPS
ncbi:hypothetical protein Tco_0770700 [Tanacetum coccineum]|uniref:Uncharacterized protein n=1 Tax=Tanacetum coccineum TaxID=301880 RepID=A0ABQ4ZCY8_9ASTR